MANKNEWTGSINWPYWGRQATVEDGQPVDLLYLWVVLDKDPTRRVEIVVDKEQAQIIGKAMLKWGTK